MMQDIRQALRALRNSPGFTCAAILSLALGIGANTTIFSLIDAVMLRSLNVSHPEELLQVALNVPGEMFANPAWEAIRDRQDVFAKLFAYGRWRFDLACGGESRFARGALVSGQYFETLGLRASLGRTLRPADDWRGCPGVAVLTDRFWKREYSGRADVIGKTILLDSHPIEIVGVSEPGFTGIDVGSTTDILTPICAERLIHGETTLLDRRASTWLRIVGRPARGVSPPQAAARMNTLAPEIFKATLPENLAKEEQEGYFARTFVTESAAIGLSFLRDRYRRALLVLMVIAGLVLLIACANVANLLLARGASRQREISIRLALGAGRGRLIRQLLTESLLLAGIGAALGLLFAKWGAQLLVSYLQVYLDLTPDVRVLGFTIGAAVLTGLLFGIAPAWRGSQVEPQSALKANSRGVIEGSKFSLGKMLVILQVALSLLLLAGASLMVSTFWKLTTLDAGFDRDRVLMTFVDLRNGHYTPERRLAAFREILEKLRAAPGVLSASASNIAPIGPARWKSQLEIEGYTSKSREAATVSFNQVSDRYFETLGTSIIAGRDFNSHDSPGSPPVAIVNQTLARKYFGETSPLGKHYRMWDGGKLLSPVEIIGVVRDFKYGSLREAIPPTVFSAWNQDPEPWPDTAFEVRAAGGSGAGLIASAKAAIGAVNGKVAIQFKALSEEIDDSLQRERLLATLSGFFGVLALLLAALGLYGVMSHNVVRRRNEIGIRMALGAEHGRVMRMVLGEVAMLTGIGLAVGLGAVLATTRFVASLLYGVTPNDPITLVVATSVLAGVALLSGYFPARRASRMDPMRALREE